MKLKIFTDIRYIPPQAHPVNILEPFLINIAENQLAPWKNLIVEYANISQSLFEIASLDRADFAILPFDWIYVRGSTWKPKIDRLAMDLGLEFANIAKQANKPLIVFFSNDASHEPIPIPEAFVFRQSLLATEKRSRDFAFYANYEDLVKYYLNNEVKIRQKSSKPVVGFNGFASEISWDIKFKELVYRLERLVKGGVYYFPYAGHKIRTEALEYLAKSPEIETKFVIREKMAFFDNTTTVENKLKMRLEYVQNMVDSDYILCCRGRGNFSFRLFEALCCGRIPIFINTNCVLPYDFAIDWKKYCVWVESQDLPHIAQKVVEFHNKLSPQEFVDLQHECRQLWRYWLSTDGFFVNFWRHLQIGRPEKNLLAF